MLSHIWIKDIIPIYFALVSAPLWKSCRFNIRKSVMFLGKNIRNRNKILKVYYVFIHKVCRSKGPKGNGQWQNQPIILILEILLASLNK